MEEEKREDIIKYEILKKLFKNYIIYFINNYNEF